MNRATSLAALSLAALGLWKSPAAAPGAPTPGMLARIDREGHAELPCPLEHTAVEANVQGPVARVKVRQIFRNDSNEPIEALYTFPLAANGAVDQMTIRIGDRVVKGAIKRKEEARAIYEAARKRGQLAGLLDQDRPNVFVQSVANIPPGAKVEVEIQYVEALQFEAGRYEFVFPMVVGPRYSPKDNPGAFRNPTYAGQGTRAGHDISIAVKLEAGLPMQSIDSTTHEVIIDKARPGAALITLRNMKEIPNKDFILRWDVTGAKVGDALLTHRGADGNGYFAFLLAPPDIPAREDVTPKEIVFVIDTSGSMHGFPLEKAKEAMLAAIGGLNPRDRFNLITFSGDTHLLFPQPVPSTPQNIADAKQFLSGRRAGGGTEMMRAIRTALAPSESREHVRVVCFMTDGYVGNEAAIIQEIRRHPEARVFSFGVGSSVNRYLLDQMAIQGRGEVEYVGLQDDGSAAARKFHQRVQSPLLTDIQLTFQNVEISDVLPSRIPDLFSAKPVVVMGRFRGSGAATVRVTGKMGGHAFERMTKIQLPANASRDGICSLWARAKVAELMTDAGTTNSEAITKLGLEYALMTPYTSFVAVEEKTITEGGKLRTIEVPVEVPEGVDGRMAGADMSMMQPAPMAAGSAGFGGFAPNRRTMATAPVGMAGGAMDREAPRKQMPLSPSEKMSPEVAALAGSNTKVGVRIYLRNASATTLEKLKKAGLHIVAQPGGGKLVVGEIQGTKLLELAALQEVFMIAAR